MRAVVLSNPVIQKLIENSFIPLKVIIKPRDEFPLAWPAMAGWRRSYQLLNGEGFTGCWAVSPDLQVEYGNTGSAMVWDLFDAIA